MLIKPHMIKVSMGVAFLVVLTGCAKLNSIHRTSALKDKGQVEFIDAKQRAIIYSGENDAGIRRFCSEPSPDVFSVFASSGALKASAEKGGTVGGELGFTVSENGSTIERTQLINMLRESMFRTCERFLNEAISKDELSIQAARDQRVMLAALAIEQLTGISRPKPTILTTSAAISLAEDTKTRLDRLDSARKGTKDAKAELTTAQSKETSKKEAYDKLNMQGGTDVCDSLIAGSTPTLTPPAKPPTKAECEAAKAESDQATAAVVAAKEKVTEAEEYETAVTKIVQLPSGTNASVSGSVGSSGDGSNVDSASDRQAIAAIVERIVLSTTRDTSEITFSCKEIIKSAPDGSRRQDFCINVLSVQFANNLQLASGGRIDEDKTIGYLKSLGASPKQLEQSGFLVGKPDLSKVPPTDPAFWQACIDENMDKIFADDSPLFEEEFATRSDENNADFIDTPALLYILTESPQNPELKTIGFMNDICREVVNE